MQLGGKLRAGTPVQTLSSDGRGYALTLRDGGRVLASKIVIAAGLGSKALASQIGIELPIRPQRGQILVTERVQPFLPLPTMDVRKTTDGTVMIGSTHEEVGYNASVTGDAAGWLSAQAVRCFPDLGGARLVRQWAALRIMTPDGFPIYEEAEEAPGVFLVQCHSGVTLAATHASALAAAVLDGRILAASAGTGLMFRNLHNDAGEGCQIEIDGVSVTAEIGESIAAVILRQPQP